MPQHEAQHFTPEHIAAAEEAASAVGVYAEAYREAYGRPDFDREPYVALASYLAWAAPAATLAAISSLQAQLPSRGGAA